MEEIDTMYLLHVNPRKSAKWIAPPPDQLITTEKLVRGASRTGADIEHDASQETMPGAVADHAE